MIVHKDIRLNRATVSQLTAVEVMTDSCHGIGTMLPLPASEHRDVDQPHGGNLRMSKGRWKD